MQIRIKQYNTVIDGLRTQLELQRDFSIAISEDLDAANETIAKLCGQLNLVSKMARIQPLNQEDATPGPVAQTVSALATSFCNITHENAMLKSLVSELETKLSEKEKPATKKPVAKPTVTKKGRK